MIQDLRHAARTLRRSPAYTTVALITLMLGIGANTAVFSLVHGVLLSALPYPSPERLVRVREVGPGGGEMHAAWRNFTDWREAATHFDVLAAHSPDFESTVLGAGDALRTAVAHVSDGFFDALRVDAGFGRALTAGDHRFGAPPAIVVSERFWRTYLGERRDLDDARLTVAGFDAQVVGVMPAGFNYPGEADIWIPVELTSQSEHRTAHNYEVIGRLAAGATLHGARTQLTAITERFADDPEGASQKAQAPDYFPVAASVKPLLDTLVGSIARPLWILMGAALLVLLIACTNLASTSLARGTAREREYAVRHAMGAGRGRLVRVIFAETLILAGIGGAAGVGLAALLLRVLPAFAPAGMPRLGEVSLSLPVLGFTALLAFTSAAAAGMLPGLRIAGSAMRSLRSGTRGTDGPQRQRVWKILVAAETALAIVLLVCAGLLLRSFQSVMRVQPGFDTSGVLTATISPPAPKYESMDARRLYFDALLEQLRAVPGVQLAGVIAQPPLAQVSNGLLQVEHGPRPDITADYQIADAGFFAAIGIPLLTGRLFEDGDREETEHVVVVNRAFAQAAWPGEDAIGKRITGGGMDNYWNQEKWATVIGIVGDVRQRDLTGEARPTAWFSYRQRPFRTWTLTAVLRPGDGLRPNALVAPVRSLVRDIDVDVPVRFATIEERIGTATAARRFIMSIIAAFAAVALILACVGVYGVVSYAVERRRPEIGIRMALGAEAGRVRSDIQRDYLIACAAGALVGIGAALALTRVMQGMLFGIAPTDPVTYAAVPLLLGAATWLASYVPARRSTRISPLETMRSE